ncbi:RadC family protein [Paraferrimonas sedimenticola]|uniref:UPF0758 protein n=1 Tax=Paraferrimonas sedimenticola TaxID=375674 RepID=A0AA37RVI4_9GAMM|nr:DNA repair protein RadC [Paraferrimonas sedimenticola]GLP95332.1 UPF0758 protein [Paraferrimonas sedimenticola]
MAIRDWPKGEGPRERLLNMGASALSDAELLALLLGSGTKGQSAVSLARSILNELDGLAGLTSSSQSQLRRVNGLGPARIACLLAALELGSRLAYSEVKGSQPLTSPEHTKRFLQQKLSHKDREVFALLLLDNQHRVIEFQPVFEGTINAAAVYPREVVKIVLEKRAAALILVQKQQLDNKSVSFAIF